MSLLNSYLTVLDTAQTQPSGQNAANPPVVPKVLTIPTTLPAGRGVSWLLCSATQGAACPSCCSLTAPTSPSSKINLYVALNTLGRLPQDVSLTK